MLLYLVRHGIAEEGAGEAADEDRRLTREGAARTHQAAYGLAVLTDAPEVLLTSPKARAVQTAAILGEVFDREPIVLEALGHENPTALAEALAVYEDRSVMAVGHEPTLSHLIALLCAGSAARPMVEMKKAGCACLEVTWQPTRRKGAAILKWLATPRMLRKLGEHR